MNLTTASLLLGVAAAHGTRSSVLVAGVALLFAGSLSMSAGEYVSVHSQADTEDADLARERAEQEDYEGGCNHRRGRIVRDYRVSASALW